MPYSNKRKLGVYKTGTRYERKRGDIPTFRKFHSTLKNEDVEYFVDINTKIEYVMSGGNKAFYAFSNNPEIRKKQRHPIQGDRVYAKKYLRGKLRSPIVFSFIVREVYYDRRWKSGMVIIELSTWVNNGFVW